MPIAPVGVRDRVALLVDVPDHAARVDDEGGAPGDVVGLVVDAERLLESSRFVSLRIGNSSPSCSRNALLAQTESTLTPRITVFASVNCAAVVPEPGHLVRSTRRERGREEREHDVLLAA